jgi:hypothetical protein
MNPSDLSRAAWTGHSDAELARQYGGTRQKWSAARERLGMPASPAGHGGQRIESDSAIMRIQVPRAKAPHLRKLAKLSVGQLEKIARAH